mgnify:CR=1 FL=1
MGFAGQLSLGHALYVGLGAYAGPPRSPYISGSVRGSVCGPRSRSRCRRGRPGWAFLAFQLRRCRRLLRHPHHCLCRICPSCLRPLVLGRWLRQALLPVANYAKNDLINLARQPDHVLLHFAGDDGRRLPAVPRVVAQSRRLLLLVGNPREPEAARTLGINTCSLTACTRWCCRRP